MLICFDHRPRAGNIKNNAFIFQVWLQIVFADTLVTNEFTNIKLWVFSGQFLKFLIEHEILIAILERWPAFDSKRASARTFVA